MGTFEELVAEGAAVPLDGWDFSWFEGRGTEERPPWGYARSIASRLATVESALDLQTCGGEVTATAPVLPPLMAAVESWPPNALVASRNLPFVVRAPNEGPLPFRSSRFDLVISRHPFATPWAEIARVLKPGGTFFSQQIGAGTNRELTDFMMGPRTVGDGEDRSTHRARFEAEKAGLEVLRLEPAALRVAFFDVGAVVHFLRKVLWTVPGFTVEGYWDRLLDMHAHIQEHGEFVSTSQRFLIEARKP
ncbi:methyltransferase domain-containing protein [Lentzea sp. NPDC051213]|uniref:methyltransferase domain-containing protein n=1 Tax=Lentzea sp. NPDC051213 TaxID=3364126 RepID=UPI0037B6C3F2